MKKYLIYEIYINGKYDGWYESEDMAKNFVSATPNAEYRKAYRLMG